MALLPSWPQINYSLNLHLSVQDDHDDQMVRMSLVPMCQVSCPYKYNNLVINATWEMLLYIDRALSWLLCANYMSNIDVNYFSTSERNHMTVIFLSYSQHCQSKCHFWPKSDIEDTISYNGCKLWKWNPCWTMTRSWLPWKTT